MLKALLLSSALAFPLLASAGPAAWYKWQSLTQVGTYVCTQTYPGTGWKRIAGPYTNAGCRNH
ncbi:MAG: hypothetical protein PW845_11240 [Pseudomonas sp.]|uniref:hypothetical protein n=1 Tax=Pseudomonas abieticivorans TaxID=2931382 RepID=UPI0020BF388D|nr:hypothetical protein [Pseudomonas sp. PIA16]MDE1165939.1 hypothetical protein [Pseudomonas sp.]